MDFNINFSKMSYKEICEYVLEIDNTDNPMKESEKGIIMNLLVQDNRKTVQKLGSKIFRSFQLKEKEVQRVKRMYEFDINFGDYNYIAGVDEVGRGPLAGPIVAAAVILDLSKMEDKDLILRAKDSKKLSVAVRKELSFIIKEKALAYKIIAIDNDKIDKTKSGLMVRPAQASINT